MYFFMAKNHEPSAHFMVFSSQWLLYLRFGLHFISLLACWLNDLNVYYQSLLSLLVVLSWFSTEGRYKTPNRFLRYTAVNGWEISMDQATYLPVAVQAGTVVWKLVIILCFVLNGRGETLIICKDAMSANDFRKLTVYLKTTSLNQSK